MASLLHSPSLIHNITPLRSPFRFPSSFFEPCYAHGIRNTTYSSWYMHVMHLDRPTKSTTLCARAYTHKNRQQTTHHSKSRHPSIRLLAYQTSRYWSLLPLFRTSRLLRERTKQHRVPPDAWRNWPKTRDPDQM